MPAFPKLRSDLVSVEAVVDGATVHNLKDPITGNYFRLREPEFWLIHQLDGQAAPSDIAARFRDKFGLEIGVEDVAAFITKLEQLFFLEDGRSEQEVARAAKKVGRKRSIIGRILYIKIKGFVPGRFLDRLTLLVARLRHPIWVITQAAVIVVGLIELGANAAQFGANLTQLFTLSSIWIVILALFLLVGMHEFAHAAVCRFYGGQVREMGFLLLYLQPCFYCDLSDAWLFKKKSQRLAVTWAGPYFQLCLLAVSVIVWRLTIPGVFVNELARITATVSWLTFLFNFNPLIKLDGYYLLSDWLEIPNLRQKAFDYMGNVFRRRVLGWPIEVVQVTARERRIYSLYAILALIYSIFLVGFSLWLIGRFVYVRWGGFALLLSIVAFALIIRETITSLARGVVQHFKFMKALLHRPGKLAAYLIILVIVVLFITIPWYPHRVSGEVIVTPIEQFTLSMNSLGLLESTLRRGGESPDRKSNLLKVTSSDLAALQVLPLVKDGQAVKSGDTLAMVTSNQVAQSIVSAQADLKRLEDEMALLKAPPKKEQIAEASAQVKAAQANLEQLQRELKRTNELTQKNLLATDKLEAARSAVDVAKAELDNRRSSLNLLKSPPRPEEEAVILRDIEKQKSNLEYFKQQSDAQIVITPIAGVVTSNRRADTILTVANNSTVELEVPVSDFDILLVAKDQAAMAKVRSFPGQVFEGRVVRIPRFTGNSSDGYKYPVSVLVDNSANLLRQGMSGYAKIEVGKTSLINLLFRKVLSALRVEFWSWW
jgi:putative peptide zinc metalloprotease protein